MAVKLVAVTVMTLQTRVRYNTEEAWLGLAEETNVTATVSETNFNNVKPETPKATKRS